MWTAKPDHVQLGLVSDGAPERRGTSELNRCTLLSDILVYLTYLTRYLDSLPCCSINNMCVVPTVRGSQRVSDPLEPKLLPVLCIATAGSRLLPDPACTEMSLNFPVTASCPEVIWYE